MTKVFFYVILTAVRFPAKRPNYEKDSLPIKIFPGVILISLYLIGFCSYLNAADKGSKAKSIKPILEDPITEDANHQHRRREGLRQILNPKYRLKDFSHYIKMRKAKKIQNWSLPCQCQI